MDGKLVNEKLMKTKVQLRYPREGSFLRETMSGFDK